MKSCRISFALLIALFILMISAAAALAQTPAPVQVTDDQVNAVARELYCPVCENIPLDVCPTQACMQWRDLIRQKLSIGWSKDQIKEYFRQQYGDRVLAAPPTEGLNMLVYILPPVCFLVGVYLVYRVLHKRKPAAAAGSFAAPPVPAADDPYMQRLEDELKKRK
jgi:cytochrome c-type biogenesis protein CcmH